MSRFLTCFAHVFPLKKIMAIWDSLVLCGSGMVVCIGIFCLSTSMEPNVSLRCGYYDGDTRDITIIFFRRMYFILLRCTRRSTLIFSTGLFKVNFLMNYRTWIKLLFKHKNCLIQQNLACMLDNIADQRANHGLA